MFARQICRGAWPCVNAARAFSTSNPNRLSKMMIVGNLVDAPELIATSTGRELLTYTVASNTGPRDDRKTNWWRIAAFVPSGPARDRIMTLGKGSLVFVEGEASMRKYDDKEGKPRSSLNIVQRNLDIIRRKERTELEPSE